MSRMAGPDRTPASLTGRGSAVVSVARADSLIDWLQASGRGDQDAFASLYDAVSSRVHGLVLRVVRNPAQADEVTQEVFLDIWRQSARFDPQRGSALSWMLTIAHRRAVDRVRSAQATTERDSAWVAENQDTPHDSTAERAERSLDAQRVRNALDALTDTQRGAVELAYFGGYTHTGVCCTDR